MIPKKYRLKKTKEIMEVIQAQQKVEDDFLVIKKNKNNKKISRFCFVVSQKISKKAVLRNKIKRRLKMIVRKNLKDIKPGFDVIFFAKKRIIKADFQQIKQSVETLLKKAGLL